MKALWGRLEAWAQKQGQSLRLRSGVTEKKIAAAEKKMRLRFPADVKSTLLLFDGQDTELHPLMWCPGCGFLSSLDEIVEQHAQSADDADSDAAADDITDGLAAKTQDGGRIRNVIFSPKRIPISGAPYFDGDITYIDLDPGPRGTSGQLIALTSECDFLALGSSLSEHLSAYLDALEKGELVLASDGDVVPKGQPYWKEHPGEWFARRAAKHAAK